jgi:hypothetical protein
VSNIGLAQPGKIVRGATAESCERHLHQLHVCAPSKRGHTRLLYRMSMDFLDWIRYVPGIDNAWKSVAGQVRGTQRLAGSGSCRPEGVGRTVVFRCSGGTRMTPSRLDYFNKPRTCA